MNTADCALFTIKPANYAKAEASLRGTGCYLAPTGGDSVAVCCSGAVPPDHRACFAERAREALEKHQVMVWPGEPAPSVSEMLAERNRRFRASIPHQS